MWVGSNDGLYRRKSIGGKFERLSQEHDTISALYEDGEGVLWIGTEGKGLLRHTREGQLQAYTMAQGLWSDEIFEILEDGQGWLWMVRGGCSG